MIDIVIGSAILMLVIMIVIDILFIPNPNNGEEYDEDE